MKRGVHCILLVLIIILMFPIDSVAEKSLIDDFDKLKIAIETGGNKVKVRLRGNIDFGNDNEDSVNFIDVTGKKITIDCNGFNLIDANFTNTTKNRGVVKIKGLLISKNGGALTTSGNVTVEVKGKIKKDPNQPSHGNCYGIFANEKSKVTFIGNIEATKDGIIAKGNSKVNLTGNVTGDDKGINATNNSVVTINKGNVRGGSNDDNNNAYAIFAENQSTVIVNNGNAFGGNSSRDHGKGGYGLYKAPKARVKVRGNIRGGNARGENSIGGFGAKILLLSSEKVKDLTIEGLITGGEGKGLSGKDGAAIVYWNNLSQDNPHVPTITLWGLSPNNNLFAKEDNTPLNLGDKVNYTVKIKDSTGGNLSINKQNYKSGENVIIVPHANKYYKLKKIFLNNVELKSTNGVYSFLMPRGGKQTLSAEFEKQTYIVTATAGEGGTISPLGSSTVNAGDHIEYTITPNKGYEINKVLINDKKEVSDTIRNKKLIINDTNEDLTLTVSFKEISDDNEVKEPIDSDKEKIDTDKASITSYNKDLNDNKDSINKGELDDKNNLDDNMDLKRLFVFGGIALLVGIKFALQSK